MSQVKVSGNASGTGVFTIAAPNSNTNRTLTLPDNTGTLLSTATAGTVLQTVGGSNQITSAGPTTSSSTMVTSGYSLTITPTSSTSKVYITVCIGGQVVPSGASTYGAITVYRNGSNLVTGSTAAPLSIFQEGASSNGATTFVIEYVDSPASTSALTYTIYYVTTGASFQLNPFVQNMNSTAYTFMLREIAV